MKRRSAVLILLCLLLALPLLLCACSSDEGEKDVQDLCTDMVNAVMGNDFDAAYALCREACSEQEFRAMWNEMRAVLSDSSTYELEQTGWNIRLSEGVSYRIGTFQLTTDDHKTCQLEVITAAGMNGIAGFSFLDSTPFLEKTSFIPFVNIGMIVLSLASIAFCIWMLIDCAKRKLKTKLGWIILIFVGASLSLLVGAEDFDFRWGVHLFFSFSYITRNAASLGIQTRLILPIGAIIYFFLRKRITKQETEQASESDTPPKEEV